MSALNDEDMYLDFISYSHNSKYFQNHDTSGAKLYHWFKYIQHTLGESFYKNIVN